MAVEIITGPSFGGKSEFARQEITRREQDDGVLGLALVSFSDLFRVLIPGEQSQYRDQPVANSGASRLVGSAYDAAVGLLLVRELSGYIAVPSPRRAVSLSDRFGGAQIWDVTAPPDALALRVRAHVSALMGRVPRARDAESSCRRAVGTYYAERSLLVGRARQVTQTRRGRYEKGGTVQPFNEDLFVSGLSPAGRAARDQLIADGVASPTPADVFRQTLINLGRRR